MMRHTAVSQQLKSSLVTVGGVFPQTKNLDPRSLTSLLLATAGGSSSFTTSSASFCTMTSKSNYSTPSTTGRRTLDGSLTPRSPILMGCALACAATPLISVRNFSSSGGRNSSEANNSTTIPTAEDMEAWKTRAEVAEKHLKELKSVLERTSSSPRPSSSSETVDEDMTGGSAFSRSSKTNSSSSSFENDSSKPLSESEKKQKEKELEEAFQSIASGTKKIFDEVMKAANKNRGSSNNGGGDDDGEWEKSASLNCHRSHCRNTGKCHYGCPARQNFYKHHRGHNHQNYNSKNFCKPIRHRRSLPTKLAMLGLGGLFVYCLGSLAMLVGSFMMLGAVVIPAALLMSFYFLFNHFNNNGGGTDGDGSGEESDNNNGNANGNTTSCAPTLSIKQDKSTNTDGSTSSHYVCRFNWNKENEVCKK